MFRRLIILMFVCTISLQGVSYAWQDKTHLAIGQAAGYSEYYNLAAPDIAKIRASSEGPNHYFDNSSDSVVSAQSIKEQISEKNNSKGHLYGAIIESLRQYIDKKKSGKFADYYMAYVGHYVGDLVMPLHNIEQTTWGSNHHIYNDGLIENTVDFKKIKVETYTLNSEDEVIKKLAEIANDSLQLGNEMQNNQRNLTEEEVYAQLGKGASFFKAILDYADRQSQ